MGGDTDAGPVEVDLLLAGGWLITMNERREVYRDGAVAVSGTTILEVGQRSDIETRYRARRVIDTPRMVRHTGSCQRPSPPPVLS